MLDVNGVGYLVFCLEPHLGARAGARRAAAAPDRDACARGPHPSLRLRRRGRAGLVPPADHGAGRGRAARARGARARWRPMRSRRRSGAGQGGARARRRRRAEAGPAHRQRAEGQGRRHRARRRRRRPSARPTARRRRDAVSALVNLGYPRADAYGAVPRRRGGSGPRRRSMRSSAPGFEELGR